MVDFNQVNRDTYNAIAHKYISEAESDHKDKSSINQFLQTFSGTKVLDLGCGTGLVSKYLTDLGYDVTGVDFSEEMIKISRSLVPNGNFIVEDVLNIDRIKGQFDGVVASHLFIHFDRSKNIEILRKLRRLISLDSSLFIEFVPNLQEGLQIEPLDNSCKMCRYSYDSPGMLRLLNEAGYRTIFDETVKLPDYDLITMIAKTK